MHEFEDFVERSLEAATIEELGRLFLAALQDEGFENFVLAQVSAFKLKHVALSHFPKGYLAHYRDQKWERIDPVIDLSLRAASPFYWNDVLPQRALSKKQKEFMAECREIGVHSGITMPFHGPDNRVDLISISQRKTKRLNRKRLYFLYALSAHVWQRSLAFEENATSVSAPIPQLSPRELECLAWSRDGVGYNDIADRLRISHRTVEFHMANVIRKLSVRDKTSAVARAMRLGLI